MTLTFTGTRMGPAEVRRTVDALLAEFLTSKSRNLTVPHIAECIDTLREFLFSGGKRIRPVMCVSGWRAARGRGDPRPVLKAAAALEMFHAFTLVHDDVMDGSATRRGLPSVHRALAERRRAHGFPADAERFGINAAVLLGDLALAWSDEMLHTADLTSGQLRRALPVLDTMRTEVMSGQYLDLLAAGRPVGEIGNAPAISRFKTAKYTIERPLHLGAALAGTDDAVMESCTAYGIPIGEAFQLRDDLLGVFGSPAATGKPVIDDLREGKHTVLMALAAKRATPAELRVLRTLVGSPDLDEGQADAVRAVLRATGARREVERMIVRRRRAAMDALDAAPFPTAVITVLGQLAHAASVRTS